MYKIGDKVVPHDKRLGLSLKDSIQCKLAAENNQKFLYVIGVNAIYELWCSFKKDGKEGEWFLKTDLTPYIEEKIEESGLFTDFVGLKLSNINGKELLDLFDRGILKETDEFVMGRK